MGGICSDGSSAKPASGGSEFARDPKNVEELASQSSPEDIQISAHLIGAGERNCPQRPDRPWERPSKGEAIAGLRAESSCDLSFIFLGFDGSSWRLDWRVRANSWRLIQTPLGQSGENLGWLNQNWVVRSGGNLFEGRAADVC